MQLNYMATLNPQSVPKISSFFPSLSQFSLLKIHVDKAHYQTTISFQPSNKKNNYNQKLSLPISQYVHYCKHSKSDGQFIFNISSIIKRFFSSCRINWYINKMCVVCYTYLFLPRIHIGYIISWNFLNKLILMLFFSI